MRGDGPGKRCASLELFSLPGGAVIVTGVSSGIGDTLARRLGIASATVLAAPRGFDRLV